MKDEDLLKSEHVLTSRQVMYYYTRVLAAAGTLRLTNKRLFFTPSGRLDRSFGAKEVVIPLRRVTSIVYKGLTRARLVVRTDAVSHVFLDRRSAPDFIQKVEETIRAAAPEGEELSGQVPKSAMASSSAALQQGEIPEVALVPHEGSVLVLGNTDFFNVSLEKIVAELDVVVRCVDSAEQARTLFREHLDEWSLVIVNLLEESEGRLACVRELGRSARAGTLPVWIVEPLFDKPDPEPFWELGVSGFLSKATSPNEVSDLLNELLRGDSTPASRRHLRTATHFPVEVKFENRQSEVYARAIGRSAIFVEYGEPPRLGTELGLRFRVPGGDRIIGVSGEVVYMRPGRGDAEAPAGMGIKFRELDPDNLAVIEEYLGRLSYKVNEQSVVFGL